jgi:hypothetical protein
LVTKHDRIALEIVVKMVVRMRTTEVKASELSSLIAVLGKLGMNPTARAKMNLPEPELPAALNPFAQFDELDELDD